MSQCAALSLDLSERTATPHTAVRTGGEDTGQRTTTDYRSYIQYTVTDMNVCH